MALRYSTMASLYFFCATYAFALSKCFFLATSGFVEHALTAAAMRNSDATVRRFIMLVLLQCRLCRQILTKNRKNLGDEGGSPPIGCADIAVIGQRRHDPDKRPVGSVHTKGV